MREVWQKALAYFGLAEDEFYQEEEEFDEENIYQTSSSTVRKINRTPDLDRAERASSLRSVAPPGRVHIIEPRTYNDAQIIADKFKSKIPVIINLQECDKELTKRIIDFGSGLTYGLNGNMRRISDKVFLVTPSNVTVSAEEKRRLRQRGFFFDKL